MATSIFFSIICMSSWIDKLTKVIDGDIWHTTCVYFFFLKIHFRIINRDNWVSTLNYNIYLLLSLILDRVQRTILLLFFISILLLTFLTMIFYFLLTTIFFNINSKLISASKVITVNTQMIITIIKSYIIHINILDVFRVFPKDTSYLKFPKFLNVIYLSNSATKVYCIQEVYCILICFGFHIH